MGKTPGERARTREQHDNRDVAVVTLARERQLGRASTRCPTCRGVRPGGGKKGGSLARVCTPHTEGCAYGSVAVHAARSNLSFSAFWIHGCCCAHATRPDCPPCRAIRASAWRPARRFGPQRGTYRQLMRGPSCGRVLVQAAAQFPPRPPGRPPRGGMRASGGARAWTSPCPECEHAGGMASYQHLQKF